LINNIIQKLATKPIIADKKIFIILNIENMNEIAQNKLLKSLEEPNPCNVFILTCAKTDKVLPTVLSRVNKIFVPKLSKDDLFLIKDNLIQQNISIDKYIGSDLSLTDIINNETNEDYKNTVTQIYNIFVNLKTSSDIPNVVSKIYNIDKNVFFPIMQQSFLSSLKNNNSSDPLINLIKTNFSEKAIIRCLDLIEKYYIMQMSNVNFTYLLDNLLFNILKEKFLCK